MRPTLALLLALGVWVGAGCSTTLDAFRCQVDSDCVAEGAVGGRCETNSFCSFSDSACGVDGRRYGSASGELGSECVGAVDETVDASRPPQVDASVADAKMADAAGVDADIPPMPDADIPCTAGPAVFDDYGIETYTMPAGCDSVTVEAFGAGGGGANVDITQDSGAGGGAGSGAAVSVGVSPVTLIAAGGGGGGSTDDTITTSPLGGSGGGGGYAIGTFVMASGTSFSVIVGQGGKNNALPIIDTGGDGGDPGGGLGGVLGPGQDATIPWGGGGGGGAARGANGGGSVYGGGGGAEEDGGGGGSTYGGAGSGGIVGGACGVTTFGGACNGVAGGGGGFFVDPSATAEGGSTGSAGSGEVGGGSANGGNGVGGAGGNTPTDGGDGRVIVTPSD